jgi:fatty acid synthase
MVYNWDLEFYLFSGPSFAIDTACSSSMYALEHAYRAMKNGQCDSAIVAGSNLCLHPLASLRFFRAGVLSQQGICRTFDRDGMDHSSVKCDMYMLIIMILL